MPPDDLTPELLGQLRQIVDRQQIIDCLLRYTRGVDRHDVDLIDSAYTGGAKDDHGRFIGPGPDVAEFVNRVHDARAECHHHQVTNHTVDIDGDTAHAESYFVAYFRLLGSETVEVLGGRYVDRLVRTGGEWRIDARVVIQEWGGALEHRPITTARELFSQGTHDRNDLSYARPLRVDRPPRDLSRLPPLPG